MAHFSQSRAHLSVAAIVAAMLCGPTAYAARLNDSSSMAPPRSRAVDRVVKPARPVAARAATRPTEQIAKRRVPTTSERASSGNARTSDTVRRPTRDSSAAVPKRTRDKPPATRPSRSEQAGNSSGSGASNNNGNGQGNDGRRRSPPGRDRPDQNRPAPNGGPIAGRPDGPGRQPPRPCAPGAVRSPNCDGRVIVIPLQPTLQLPRQPVVMLPLPSLPQRRPSGSDAPDAPAFAPQTPYNPPSNLGPPATPRPPVVTLPPVLPTQPAVALAEYVADEVLITVATSAPETLELTVAQAFNVTLIERTELPMIDARLVRLRIPDQRSVPAVVAALQADPRISLAQPNYLYRHQQGTAPSSLGQATVQPAALMFSNMQYAPGQIQLDAAHRVARGSGTIVAVIDSGVDRAHPDFAAANIEHFDAANDGAAAVNDTHGTGIVGIIAARGSLRGVAPDARILSARVFRGGVSGQAATATTAHLLKGVHWAVANGARILNLSFAGPRDRIFELTVQSFSRHNLIAIAAAGNHGPTAPPAYPAAYAEVIAVTAVDAQDKLYEKANRGAYVAVAAPGVDIIVPGAGASHHFQSGTSFAAAHISGIVALMLEVNPSLSADAVRTALSGATTDLGPPGRDDQFGAGRINAAEAVRLAGAPRAMSAK